MADLRQIFSDLVRFETELWDAVDARLRAECDLPLTWFEPMLLMAASTACRVYDIAAELSITVGGTSKLVDRIEAAGLCMRRANPEDRRSSILVLTSLGRRLLAQAAEVVDAELADRIGAIPTSDLAQFSRTLSALRTAASRAPGSERAGGSGRAGGSVQR
jgi:DNA-binding MarR family transcriptional regulator